MTEGEEGKSAFLKSHLSSNTQLSHILIYIKNTCLVSLKMQKSVPTTFSKDCRSTCTFCYSSCHHDSSSLFFFQDGAQSQEFSGNNYRLITAYLLLRVNLDKIMHARWDFDASSAQTRRVSALDKHQNWSASALFCLNSQAQSKYAVVNLIHTWRKQSFLSSIMW